VATPEKIEFLEKHKEILAPIIERENARRSRRSLPILSEAEIDSGLDQIMKIEASGKDFSTYRFPPPMSGVSIPQKEAKPSLESGKTGIVFEVQKCENGFLMVSGGVQYIFRTPKELMGILSGVVFGEKSKA